MLNRSRKITHPQSVEIITPLLVPSFSSKGFYESKAINELPWIFKNTVDKITEAFLISAFDINCGYLNLPENATTDVVILDSGGYEVLDCWDESEVFKEQKASLNTWSVDKLKAIINTWPDYIPCIFVSFDCYQDNLSFSEQVALAMDLFNGITKQMKLLLIKPENTSSNHIDIDKLVNVDIQINEFDVVGLAEKQLGSSILERMINISKLRNWIDKKGKYQPIHIFGSLDPISVALYYYSGAEIFDGLSWLKYSYQDHIACYHANASCINDMIDVPLWECKLRNSIANLEVIKSFKRKLIHATQFNDTTVLPESVTLLLKKYASHIGG